MDIKNLGPNRQVKLIKIFKSAENIFNATIRDLESIQILTKDQISQIKALTDLKPYEICQKRWEDYGVECISFLEQDFPQRLLETASFPTLLFYRGDISVLHQKNLLGVVGTRKITDYGKRIVSEFIPKLCQKDVVIVSGLAFGVDVASHLACLDHQGKTIAVQAQGVERGFPRAHQNIYQRIINEGGCVVSEFPFMSDDDVDKFHFPRRNRLISGMSDGILVIEAGEKSGSLITARYATEQNRDVYAIPGNLQQKMSLGCLQLIKQGAKIVLSDKDILEDLGLSNQQHVSVRIPTDHFETPLENDIFNFCQKTPRSLDDIIESTVEPASFVSATITKMQLMGRLKEVDGRKFVAM